VEINRRKFVFLALSMSSAAGCIIAAPPPQQPAPGAAPDDPNATGQGAAPGAPTDECVDWDANNECIRWAGDATGPAEEYAPVAECVNWDANNECIQWADE